MLELQKHKHSKTCRKGGKPICRFGFTKPPMNRTMLLKSIEIEKFSHEEYITMKQNFKLVSQLLADSKDGMSFEKFLIALGLTEEEYLNAICSSFHNNFHNKIHNNFFQAITFCYQG